MIESDRIRVIEGNYDTYQQLLAGREPAAPPAKKSFSRAQREARPRLPLTDQGPDVG